MANKTITVKVYSQTGENVSEMGLDASVFGVKVNKSVMFDAVQVYQSNLRQATAKTKTRAEVSGGGKKPWRQKGTGRARAGSNTSPIWVGGGQALGPTGTQNYKISQNKKEHLLALKSALTLKAENGLIVVDSIKVEPKTKIVKAMLEKIGANKKVLLVTSDADLALGARNLDFVMVREATNVCVYELLNVDYLVATVEEIKNIEEALA
ncbi:MAG: 50S ribosomal protein L4 [Bacilli bacterium]